MSIDILVNQLEEAVDSKFYFLALTTALTLPDIAAAISSSDGCASRKKYIDWYDKWVSPQFGKSLKKRLEAQGVTNLCEIGNPFTGSACYYYRCAVLHQSRTTHDKLGFSRILFIEPGSTKTVHHYGTSEDALIIDLPSFCQEIISGFREWMASAKGTENYEKNIQETLRRYDNGFAPHIGGVPVIT